MFFKKVGKNVKNVYFCFMKKKEISIGGENTAKRKILIREYMNEKRTLKYSKSNPFEEDDVSEDENENGKTKDQKPKKAYIPEELPYDKNENVDEILTKNINLDEADKFIASLKLPKKKKEKNTFIESKPSKQKHFYFAEFDFTRFQKESEKLQALYLAESQDKEEFDDLLL